MSRGRFNKVKRLARAGWRGGTKPDKAGGKKRGLLSRAGSAAKAVGMTAGKMALKEGKMALKEGKKAALKYGNSVADQAIRSAGAEASVYTANPLPSVGAEIAIRGKDHLLQKHFGTHHNSGGSHSGKNYAIKRKPATQYHSPSRAVRTAPAVLPHVRAATFRNTSHLYSAPHPTGAKI